MRSESPEILKRAFHPPRPAAAAVILRSVPVRIIASLVWVAVAVAGTAFPVSAQETPPIPTLTVSADGVAYAEPDVALVSFGVSTRGRTPSAALEENSTAMQAVIDATKAAGVADVDIATTGFFINPVYGQQDANAGDTPAPIVGYEVRNEITARIRDVSASGDTLDRVVSGGANTVTGVSFELSDPKAAEDEAIVAAINEARRKADVMATAAGVRIVRLLSVSTGTAGGGGPQPYMAFRASVPIASGQRAVTMTATVAFEVAPL